MPRAIRWSVIAVAAALVILTIAASAGSRTETLRRLVVETLAERLDSDVELQSFSVDTFPTVDVRGIRARHPAQGKDRRAAAGADPQLHDFRRHPRIDRAGRGASAPSWSKGSRSTSRLAAPVSKRPAARAANPESGSGSSPILVERLVSNDALLRLIPRREGKRPREFAIHRLTMSGVGVEERMPFEAELTNPLPRGLIRTEGRFGPWNRGNPGGTTLDGKYSFEKADLSTIKGIAGILTSTGEFGGQLERIQVKGETRTPDFRLKLSDKAVPLTTRFEAVVDGTDGDTYLNSVDAKLASSAIAASGAVVGTPGVRGRTVQLKVKVTEGQIEDFLALAVKADRPVMTGRIALHTDFLLPPGPDDVVEKLRLDGEFDLSVGALQRSRRAREVRGDEPACEGGIRLRRPRM